LIRNHPKLCQGLTLEGWCLYLACPTGTSQCDKHNLSQWDRQIGTRRVCPSGTSTAPCQHRGSLSQLGLGKVKRDLSLSHGTSHIPTLETFPCRRAWDKLYTHNGACPSSTCPNLSHKVGLQGRGTFLSFLSHNHLFPLRPSPSDQPRTTGV